MTGSSLQMQCHLSKESMSTSMSTKEEKTWVCMCAPQPEHLCSLISLCKYIAEPCAVSVNTGLPSTVYSGEVPQRG